MCPIAVFSLFFFSLIQKYCFVVKWRFQADNTLSLFVNSLLLHLFVQIDEDTSLVPEAIQGGTYGFNSANVPAEGFQF